MRFSRRIDEARATFNSRDKEASKKAHSKERTFWYAEEKHSGTGSQYIGEMVYGGLDGIVTIFVSAFIPLALVSYLETHDK